MDWRDFDSVVDSGIADAAAPEAFAAFVSGLAQGSVATVSTVASAALPVQIVVGPVNAVLTDAIAHETGGLLTFAGALAVLQDATKAPMNAVTFAAIQAVAHELNAVGGVATTNYVRQIFDDVALGNSANAYWNGGSNTASALGNLTANSTATQVKELIGKWFLGTDLPGVAPAPGQSGPATSYQTSSLPLFSVGGPEITDVNQGQLGDCWFLAALGETAMQDPSLLESLITAHGHNTYAVKFQVNGKVDFVTVNNQFSDYTGNIEQYDGSKMEFSSSTTNLWVEVYEKALAQLSEQSGVVTGEQYAGGANQYYELNAGGAEGIDLITGQSANWFAFQGEGGSDLTNMLGQVETSLTSGEDVLLATSGKSVSGNLVADHMFAVESINAGAGTVTLYNPWGANASGDGKAESFTIAASALVADQADFAVATGPVRAA